MAIADKLVRKFVRNLSPSFSRPNGQEDVWGDYEDPTYLCFKVDFQFFNDFNEDSKFGGLLYPDTDPNSAIGYLNRTGQVELADALYKFQETLKKISKETPWYFQSITGLSDCYKIDRDEPFRGKEKFITINCLESIDMRMTLLADLYRRISWDEYNMRELLPENMKRFNMRIYITEIRSLSTTMKKISEYSLGETAANVKNPNMGVGSMLKDAAKTESTKQGVALRDRMYDTQKDALGIFPQQQNPEEEIKALDSLSDKISVMTFVLRNCEFDFFGEAPPFLETVSSAEQREVASQVMKIKVGKIREVNTYPIRTFYTHYLKSEIGEKYEPQIVFQRHTSDEIAQEKQKMYNSVVEQNDSKLSPLEKRMKNLANFPGGKAALALVDKGISTGMQKIGEQVKKVTLGNVHNFSPGDPINTLKNLAGAIKKDPKEHSTAGTNIHGSDVSPLLAVDEFLKSAIAHPYGGGRKDANLSPRTVR